MEFGFPIGLPLWAAYTFIGLLGFVFLSGAVLSLKNHFKY